MSQFAGDESPLGQAAHRVATFVSDGSLDWLEKVLFSQLEGLLSAVDAAEEPSATAAAPTGESTTAEPLAAAARASDDIAADATVADGTDIASAATLDDGGRDGSGDGNTSAVSGDGGGGGGDRRSDAVDSSASQTNVSAPVPWHLLPDEDVPSTTLPAPTASVDLEGVVPRSPDMLVTATKTRPKHKQGARRLPSRDKLVGVRSGSESSGTIDDDGGGGGGDSGGDGSGGGDGSLASDSDTARATSADASDARSSRIPPTVAPRSRASTTSLAQSSTAPIETPSQPRLASVSLTSGTGPGPRRISLEELATKIKKRAVAIDTESVCAAV